MTSISFNNSTLTTSSYLCNIEFILENLCVGVASLELQEELWPWFRGLVPGPSVSVQQQTLPSLCANRLISTEGHRPWWQLAHTSWVVLVAAGKCSRVIFKW